MGLPKTNFDRDIVLDDEEFQKASQSLTSLSVRLETLKNKVSKSLDNLRSGFDTPAGHKFFELCENKLLDPMDDQAEVIKHVAKNLNKAKNSYQSIFDEFAQLNASIKNINNN